MLENISNDFLEINSYILMYQKYISEVSYLLMLSACAEIKSGLLLSRKMSKVESESVKIYKQLTLKSINSNGTIDKTLLENFFSNEILSPSYLTHKGDVVVRLTEPYTAVCINEEMENLVIPSHFIAIRPNEKILNPDYLAWLLNDDSTKIQLKKKESGIVLSLMKRNNYEKLIIETIPLDKQQIIAEINKSTIRESELLIKLAEEKIKLAKAVNKTIYNKEI